MIIDVRSTEEYIKNHIKGAISLPLFALESHISFLKGKEVLVYCDTGHRAKLATELLNKQGIKTSVIPNETIDQYEEEGKSIICAINYLSVKPGFEEAFEKTVHVEEEFERKVKDLCHITASMKGFLGSKIFKVSTISYGGSGLKGESKDIEVEPTKYVMLTYWTSKDVHEEFHKQPVIRDGFMSLMPFLSIMPYEEYGIMMR
ncbi:MAG: rhodanese-like domain-containing protein [Candidatus Bathyarchaeota archaeon]|nr:rhodanese-like domain-containing protein [Candidatus Bathyarchaeota archaeon]